MKNRQRQLHCRACGLLAATLVAAVACGGWGQGAPVAADVAAVTEAASDEAVAADIPRGLVTNEPGVSGGYVLFGPLLFDTTYLMGNDGMIVHTWTSQYAPSGTAYLLGNGNLLRGAREPGVDVFRGGGQGGRIEEFTWDGDKVWDFEFAGEDQLLHHDIEIMPDGSTPHPVGEFTYAVFRATRVPPDHAALSGKILSALEPQPPVAGDAGSGG